jgi:hypothetical protein
MRSLKKGKAIEGLLGWSAFISADAGIGIGGSVVSSTGFRDSPFDNQPTWISGGLGIGASIGGGFTGGLSYSWPIEPGQFK